MGALDASRHLEGDGIQDYRHPSSSNDRQMVSMSCFVRSAIND